MKIVGYPGFPALQIMVGSFEFHQSLVRFLAHFAIGKELLADLVIEEHPSVEKVQEDLQVHESWLLERGEVLPSEEPGMERV